MTTPLIIKEIDALLLKEGKPNTTMPNTPAGNRLKKEIDAGRTDKDFVAGKKIEDALKAKVKISMLPTTQKSIENDAIARRAAAQSGAERNKYLKALKPFKK